MKKKLITLLAIAATAIGVTTKAATSSKVPGMPAQSAGYFYTGKPYDEDLGAYAFAFRSYDPELNRWTTPDPTGFPDGPNPNYYAPIPTTGIDLWGLSSLNRQKAFSGPHHSMIVKE
jgi:RHS repeat-associated protein